MCEAMAAGQPEEKPEQAQTETPVQTPSGSKVLELPVARNGKRKEDELAAALSLFLF
ncbi:MAG TPA: hypothetical protein VGK74_05700 [Symbiobacteriaceae bacterium]|jgi:hypothetical protein